MLEIHQKLWNTATTYDRFLASKVGCDRVETVQHSNGGSKFGYLGGTVCSNCGRSFGIHWWSLRLGFGRLDRCPHCGKWNMVSRSSADALAAVEQLESDPSQAESTDADLQTTDDEILRRQIDESRYSDE